MLEIFAKHIDGLLSFLGAMLGVMYTYKAVNKQITIAEMPFIEFVISDNKSDDQIVRNIGTKSAINVNIFKLFRDVSTPRFADRSLIQSFGTIQAGEEEERHIEIKPTTTSGIELYIIQFQNVTGTCFETVLTPRNGRGDWEKLYPPHKLRKKDYWGNAVVKSKRIKIPSYILKIYNSKVI